MSTSKIDLVKIPRSDDGRYAVTIDDEKQMLEDLKYLKKKEVAEKWGVSLTKIYWLEHPERYTAQLAKNKKVNKYDKDKATIYKQRNRAKKRIILEKQDSNP